MAPRIARSSVSSHSFRPATKKKEKRTLDALAIAERHEPDKPRIRKSRLGELEDESSRAKRRKLDIEDGLGDDTNAPQRVHRKINIDNDSDAERGSDSEGNEWQMGAVGVDDDSDLDSDEAFGESDDERFGGFAFRGSSKPHHNNSTKLKNKSNTKSATSLGNEINLDEVDEGAESESIADGSEDDLGEDAVDLATALDQWEESDTGGSQDIRQRFGQGADSDDEQSIDEAASETSFSGFSSNGDKDEDDPDEMIKMQNIISSLDTGGMEQTNQVKGPHNQLTMEDLLSAHDDPSLRRLLRKQANTASNSKGVQSGKLEPPLPKRQQDRIDRAAASQKAKEALDQWIDTVKRNRRAEHLHFPLPDDRSAAISGGTNLSATVDSAPFNELESTVQNILEESGLSSKSKNDQEDQIRAFEQLQTNKMSLAEAQARQAELRKMRELLFREEVKAKRIKRIKSKAYRRVHRKERERDAQIEREARISAGADVSDEERNRLDRQRAEARMGARHRNSKWAKDLKHTGRAAWDEDARESVTEMARRKDELNQRIRGDTIRDNIGDSDLSSEEVDDDSKSQDVDYQDQERRHLQRQINRLDNSRSSQEPHSKLQSMAFLQKAEGARHARNQQDIERLQRELDGEAMSEEADDVDNLVGRRSFSTSNKAASKASEERKVLEFEENLPSDEDDDVKEQRRELENIESVSKHKSASRPQPQRNTKNPTDRNETEDADTDANPWLTNTDRKRNSQSEKKITDQKARPRSVLESNRGQKIKSSKSVNIPISEKPSKVLEEVPDSEPEDESELAPFVLRNQDLVQKAFAGDNVVANFDEEKKEAIADEEEKIVDKTLPGWGSWIGEGISAKERKRAKGRVLQKEAGVKASDRQDAKLDRVIINEKRTKKNTKYLAPVLPHPYESQAQYERALRLPMGPEWTTKETFQNMTKPRVMVKQGVIAPMSRPMV